MGSCAGPAQKAAQTRLRTLQSLQHPVLGYRLQKPHRMNDAMLDTMGKVTGVRNKKSSDAAKAEPESNAGEGEGGATIHSAHIASHHHGPRERETSEPGESDGPRHANDDHEHVEYMKDDYDVFGHGGDLGGAEYGHEPHPEGAAEHVRESDPNKRRRTLVEIPAAVPLGTGDGMDLNTSRQRLESPRHIAADAKCTRPEHIGEPWTCDL